MFVAKNPNTFYDVIHESFGKFVVTGAPLLFMYVNIFFFSPFFRCSRLYWSTVDPRRQCKYTCKVTEVSTPLPGEEQDPRWDKEENHTIVHSPSHHRGQQELLNTF